MKTAITIIFIVLLTTVYGQTDDHRVLLDSTKTLFKGVKNLNQEQWDKFDYYQVDTTVMINFNWELENKIRQNDKSIYVSANICSRWIDFSETDFHKLKEFDGKSVKVTIRHSVIEGLYSKRGRGVDITLLQGTQNNVDCDRILTIKLNE